VFVLASPAFAQIAPDGSLSGGDVEPRTGPDFIIPASLGRVQGGNLFHSFQQFNVRAGESATFTGPGQVDAGALPIGNVIARVTGGSASEINGLLRVAIPAANLFFINPSGVTIGPGATLDVPGAVVISTANSIRFADGATLQAGDAKTPPVLSVASPAAFGFLGSPAPARIDYNGSGDTTSGLVATRGTSVSIIGGPVRISGGRILANQGNVNVVSVASAGEVVLDATSHANDPNVDSLALGPVELLNGAALQGPAGGRVVVKGESIRVDHSVINTDSDDTPGGGIDLDARGGALDIINSRIASDNFGNADGGSVRLHAGTTLTIRGASPDGVEPVSTDVNFNGPGGSVTLDAADVMIAENAAVTSFVNPGAAGHGGEITVSAGKSFTIDGSKSTSLTGLAAETFIDSSGDAGNISITAPRVTFLERAEMTSTTRGPGAAGKLTVNARGEFLIDGRNAVSAASGEDVITGLQSRVGLIGGVGATGTGGEIVVNAGSLTIKDSGVLSATTFGRGPGGSVAVDAQSVNISGTDPSRFTGIFARTQLPTNGGPGGDVTVNAKTVTLSGAAEISAASTGTGNAGKLAVHASQSILLTNGGRVTVSAGFPDPRDSADDETISVAVGAPPQQPASAGELTLTAPSVELLGGSVVSAQATLDSGAIGIVASDLVRVQNSSITATAGQTGGVIDIGTGAVVLENSKIQGFAAGADVAVTIRSDALVRSNSVIETDNLTLPPEIDIAGSLSRLPADIADPNLKLIEACAARIADSTLSSFVATGRGGSPPAPGGFISDLPIADGSDQTPSSEKRNP
jgi:filamentous hemagglutinin family protein